MKLKCCAAGLAGASLLVFTVAAAAANPVVVDCAAGGSVGAALAGSPPVNKPVLIVVKGVCSEHVSVDRNDVTLVADANGGGLTGPDPATDVVRVTGARVTIEGLAISGGRTGIEGDAAQGLRVLNVTVHNTGRNGITYGMGSIGEISGATVQGVARDGVMVEGGSVFILGSTVSGNARLGILVTNNGSARIGFDRSNQVSGNTITGNGSTGVHVSFGATATLVANEITGNGAVPNPLGRFGVGVFNASVSLVGSNNISNNSGTGVMARSSSLLTADPSFGVSTTNTVNGNGGPGSTGGVFGFLGSSLIVRDMVISGNNGAGLGLTLNSTGQMFNTVIQGNVNVPGSAGGDGIRLSLGASLLVSSASTVTGNQNVDVLCPDAESSIATNFFLGGVASFNCTGF